MSPTSTAQQPVTSRGYEIEPEGHNIAKVVSILISCLNLPIKEERKWMLQHMAAAFRVF